MIERQAAAEVAALDERDRQAARGRVVGGEQSVDAAADDQQVVAVRGQIGRVSRHVRASHL